MARRSLLPAARPVRIDSLFTPPVDVLFMVLPFAQTPSLFFHFETKERGKRVRIICASSDVRLIGVVVVVVIELLCEPSWPHWLTGCNCTRSKFFFFVVYFSSSSSSPLSSTSCSLRSTVNRNGRSYLHCINSAISLIEGVRCTEAYVHQTSSDINEDKFIVVTACVFDSFSPWRYADRWHERRKNSNQVSLYTRRRIHHIHINVSIVVYISVTTLPFDTVVLERVGNIFLYSITFAYSHQPV